jgi:hypothetical protein
MGSLSCLDIFHLLIKNSASNIGIWISERPQYRDVNFYYI